MVRAAIVATAVLALTACGPVPQEEAVVAAETNVPQVEESPANDPGMSLSEFNALQTGMSYEDAVALIGGEGTVQSENEMAGTRTVMYTFEGENGFGANASVMFQNGKLNMKSQFGLE